MQLMSFFLPLLLFLPLFLLLFLPIFLPLYIPLLSYLSSSLFSLCLPVYLLVSPSFPLISLTQDRLEYRDDDRVFRLHHHSRDGRQQSVDRSFLLGTCRKVELFILWIEYSRHRINFFRLL